MDFQLSSPGIGYTGISLSIAFSEERETGLFAKESRSLERYLQMKEAFVMMDGDALRVEES